MADQVDVKKLTGEQLAGIALKCIQSRTSAQEIIANCNNDLQVIHDELARREKVKLPITTGTPASIHKARKKTVKKA